MKKIENTKVVKNADDTLLVSIEGTDEGTDVIISLMSARRNAVRMTATEVSSITMELGNVSSDSNFYEFYKDVHHNFYYDSVLDEKYIVIVDDRVAASDIVISATVFGEIFDFLFDFLEEQ